MCCSKNNSEYDFLIVGAGLFGCTFARLATDSGFKCLIIERRNQPGGNIRTERVDDIDVHTYGAHIFHTSNAEVWDFANRFATFNRFTNSPIALYKGCAYNLPFNLNTFNRLWGTITPEEVSTRLEEQRREARESLKLSGAEEPRNLEEQALLMVGRDVYEKLIRGYTEKQWGRPCTQLPAFIIKRLPVRMTYDNNYFNDRWQGIPEGGYSDMISRMIEGIDIILGEDFLDRPQHWRSMARKTIYTGPIDRYFDYCHGKLQYRSLRFETETLDTPNYQGVAVVNYTETTPAWTRIIEHKHFNTFGDDVYKNPRTVITREYPTEWTDEAEPYYPINDERNSRIYEQYRLLAYAEKDVYFGGRLAEYRYYDMAPVVAKAIELAQKLTL